MRPGAPEDLRKYLRFHAASLEIGDRVVLFAGASGTGKSTIHALLTAEGVPSHGDDEALVILHGEESWKLHSALTSIESESRFTARSVLRRIGLMVYLDGHTPTGHRLEPCPALQAAQRGFRTLFRSSSDYDWALRQMFRDVCAFSREVPAMTLQFSRSTSFLPDLRIRLEEESSHGT